ncbi:hypothetical protein [Humibacter soli]
MDEIEHRDEASFNHTRFFFVGAGGVQSPSRPRAPGTVVAEMDRHPTISKHDVPLATVVTLLKGKAESHRGKLFAPCFDGIAQP